MQFIMVISGSWKLYQCSWFLYLFCGWVTDVIIGPHRPENGNFCQDIWTSYVNPWIELLSQTKLQNANSSNHNIESNQFFLDSQYFLPVLCHQQFLILEFQLKNERLDQARVMLHELIPGAGTCYLNQVPGTCYLNQVPGTWSRSPT